jgi:phage portal protein BeeE
MARYSAMVFGVITGRMNRIGALNWSVSKDSDDAEELMAKLQDLASVWEEWAGVPGIRPKMMRRMIQKKISDYLPDLTPDMSNFKSALQRYAKRCKSEFAWDARQIEDWLYEPNQNYSMEEFLKIWVWDLHTHGAAAVYKDINDDNTVENLHILPGGTVVPLHNAYVGGPTAYIQLIPWEATPQIMFNDELIFSRWLPSSAASYGLVPLESLVNKIAEQLLFDEQAAIQADGSKPPEKVVVFGETAPFGDLDRELSVPIEETEQKKIETVLNQRRQYAIRTLSGVGDPMVLDLSKSDIFANQAERQRQLKEDVGLVFGASNMEMNLTGSDSTSGRTTSEAEERQDLRRGVLPIIRIIEEKINREVLPYRFGSGYTFTFASGLSEAEQIDLITRKIQSGLYSVNELRTEELGLDPFPEDDFERPPQAGAQMQQPMGEDQGLLESPF